MMKTLIDVFAILFSAFGLFVFFAATVGILRFPDFYTRMHAAGKGDTLAATSMLLGLAIYELHDLSWLSVQVAIKILIIQLFLFLANPTATHAIIDAGYETGVLPWGKEPEEGGDTR